jgi:hypothetical protein
LRRAFFETFFLALEHLAPHFTAAAPPLNLGRAARALLYESDGAAITRRAVREERAGRTAGSTTGHWLQSLSQNLREPA